MITGFYLKQKTKTEVRFENEEALYRAIEKLRDSGISDDDLTAYYTTRKHLPISDYKRQNSRSVVITGSTSKGTIIITGNGNVL